MWFAALGFLVIVAVALAPLVKRDAVARFWALGMILSLLPICAVYPADRLLFFVGIGGMGLLAQLIATAVKRVEWPTTRVWRRLPVRTLCAVLVVIHLGVAPVALARTAGHMESYGRAIARAAASLPSDPSAQFKTVLIAQTPTYSTFSYGSLLRWLNDQPYLSRTLVLGSSGGPIEVSRPDEHTLVVRPEDGFLAPVGGSTLTREMGHILFNQRNAFLTLDRLFSDGRSMKIGQQVKVTPVTVEVTAVTDDGRPAEATYHFAMSLENPLLLWLKWQNGEYMPFELPKPGETVALPAVTVPF
jgi:hypothetical protein